MINPKKLALIAWAKRAEPAVNSLLGVLSILAMALVVSTELVNAHWTVPFLRCSWIDVQLVSRTIIWGAFVLSFVTYCVLSGRPLSYVRQHLLELVICVAWVPHYTEGSLSHFVEMFSLSRVVPIDVLQLAGTLSHAARVVKFTAQRFRSHPIVVVGSAALLLVASAAALLNHVEPHTFPSFWDAAWFSLTTITTIGFGDLVPKTMAGRLITSGMIILGVSLAGVFIGLVSEIVRKRLLNPDGPTGAPVHPDVQNQLDELAAQQRRTNELLHRLLAERESGSASSGEAARKPDFDGY